MDKFQTLIRGVLWLAKRDWGLSFLLAFTSFWTILGLGAQQPGGRLDALFEGPIFKAGVYVGTIIFPNYAERGTNGFYLVPLFGAAADFFLLMAVWFVVVRFVRVFRVEKNNLHEP